MGLAEELLAKALQDANARLVTAAGVIGGLERERDALSSDLAKARHLLMKAADHMEGALGTNSGSDTDRLLIDIRRIVGLAPAYPLK